MRSDWALATVVNSDGARAESSEITKSALLGWVLDDGSDATALGLRRLGIWTAWVLSILLMPSFSFQFSFTRVLVCSGFDLEFVRADLNR
ncbi:hypothetical protein M0R45_015631 [Rubus argutus]|uniref:Uncharacterized protein n=1 Tax=Rubus argutus TaxID=59490 RepID=A0AAW1XS72_RUBAR